jgi:hypothetical protein
MPARWKNDKPMSRPAFDARLSDEEACSHYLSEHRWPESFVCPSCGTCKGWPLKRNRATWECAGCARQTSVTAGTVMHSSVLPLRIWFLAAHIITSYSNGMVERFNGRISDVLKTNRFDRALDLEQTLMRNVHLYNTQLLQSALGSRTPMQTMKGWHKSHPQLFVKSLRNHAGRDK